jgi:nucleotide-binding universal stress UspA family protein
MKRVLVATDLSQSSEKALHHAIAIARRYGAKFYLAHVVPSPSFTLAGDAIAPAAEAAARDVKRLESKLLETGALAGIQHEVVVRQGSVWQQLEQFIEQEHVDLVVAGTHGRTGLRKLVLGSVAEEIFRHSSCPVLTVGPRAPNDPPPHLSHVLYPTDLSAESAQAARYAVSAAKEHGARLTLLHVIERLEGEAAGDRERVISVLEARLREFLPFGDDLPYNLNVRVEIGPIDETILGFAGEQGADLIVLGLRSPDTFVDHLGWLHAYKIVCEACCPVLTGRLRKLIPPENKAVT